MNNLLKIHKRLYSFCAYNLLLYANFLLLFSLAANLNATIIHTIALKLLPTYLLVGISGYFLNDLFDVKADELSNKFNITTILNKYVVLFIILFFGLIGFYLLFTISKQASLVLVFQFLLLLGYSLPFIRLKEKGILGLITDAIYAHVIPGIILLYALQEYIVIPLSLCSIFILFLFLLGLRDIAIHQFEDLEKDIQSNTKTFAVKNQETIKSQINKLNLFSALGLCALLFFFQTTFNSLLFLALFICLTISYTVFFVKNKNVSKDVLMNNYILLSSILFLYMLIDAKNFIGIILLLHPYFLQKTRSFINYILVTIIPLTINYFLYYFFILLGRNLKEKPLSEKKSELLKKH
ncbi:UbiA family prenyltransferase [Flavobacterium sp. 123]|uniref:UbiA family prenyltransferase n=1 Tax=Flavobacterium sp. 123 TaxID=2135627 RepID=UPI000EAFA5A9|nr:UbiA family prenyltransferase [Flavobacterium sp. 123]RKS99666.1 4-hydroxybenzoate polyprenyltransferase [Flavobacterium sp. 123]